MKRDMILQLLIVIYLLCLTACSDGSDAPSSETERPVANAGADQIVVEKSTVILSGNGSDPTSSTLSYRWIQTVGTAVTVSDPDQPTAYFDAPQSPAQQTLTFELIVTNAKGATGKDTVNVIVNPINQQDSAHFDILPDEFEGSIDFVDAMILSKRTGVTHTITLERFHGSEGDVAIDYQSNGDFHQAVRGTMAWKNGEIGRKSFQLTIPFQNQEGEHRVYIDLLNPSGSVRLGRGGYTRMYIITDDGSKVPDAVWVNSSTGDDANSGTELRPMKTISAAIKKADENLSNNIYLTSGIYNMGNEPYTEFGGSTKGVLLNSRTGEENRLTIRTVPGEGRGAIIDGIDNSSHNRIGFFARDATGHTGDFITISNLTMRHLLSGVKHSSSKGEYVIAYNNDISHLDGVLGSNVSGLSFWGVASAIAFNNKITTSRVAGVVNGNDACILSFHGKNLFIQQNTFSDCYNAVYHKQSPQDVDTGTQYTSSIIRRNKAKDIYAAAFRLPVMGGYSPGHSYSLISQNITTGTGVTLAADPGGATPLGHHNEISHNIFDRRRVTNDLTVIGAKNHRHTSFYGNIVMDQDSSFYLHRFEWSAIGQPEPSDDEWFDAIDKNIFIDPQGRSPIFSKGGYSDTYSWDIAKTWGIEVNSVVITTPEFVHLPETHEDFFTGDFHLIKESFMETFAPGNLPAGPYIVGNEQIGADF